MIYRFRRGIIGPLAIFWLIVTVASVVMGAVAWSRFSRSIEASAETEHFRESIHQLKRVHQMTWIAGLLGVGAGLFALYFYRVDYYQERARRLLLEEKLHAEQAVREKSAFLANMSHEIRSPMNAILGFSELLEPEGLTPKQSQYVRAIRDSGAALLHLINDILDLSKLEAGKLELHPEPTDMRDSCEFLRTVFGQQAVMKSLRLQFELSPNLPRALLLDRLRLRQVLVNLLSNAVKFTERGCVKARVSWESQGDGRSGTLLIDVEDTGVGIAADELEEVFKPFVQAESLRTAEKEGTGIGLTIVKRLTELMGGSLAVESTVGQGTVFHLRFAKVPVSGRLPVGDHAEPGGAVDFNDFAPATLLVVDDNPTNRALMAGIFEKTHHQVQFANNGQEALECLGEGQARRCIAGYPDAGDGRADGPGGDPQASQPGVAAGHRGHGFEQGRRRAAVAKPIQRVHPQALLEANALSGAGPVSPKGVARQRTGTSESRTTARGHLPSLCPIRRRSGRNWLWNCAGRRQRNGPRCVTAWR